MDEALELMTKFRSRKWMLTLLVLGIGTVFAALSLLTPQFSELLIGLIVSYNVFQGLIDWQKAR